MELFNTSAYTSTIVGDRTSPLSKTEARNFDPSWNTPAYSVESVDLSLELSTHKQISKPPSLWKLTRMRSQFLIIGFRVYQYIQISMIIFLRESATYLQLVFLAQALRLQGSERDCRIQNQVYGLKHCDVSRKLNPDSLSSNNQPELSTKDYEQSLGDSEWQDILLKLKRSRQDYSALLKKEKGSSLLPTPTTYGIGSRQSRPAGTTKLEERLRAFIAPKEKLNPGVPGWMMAFPAGWAEKILLDGGEATSVQLPFTQEYVPTCQDVENVTIYTQEVYAPSKQPLPSKESSTSTHLRQGSLAPFIETKKLKYGLRTYPHIEGFRDPDNYKHWRWGFYYEVKIGDTWHNRSKSVTSIKAPIIKKMLADGDSCDRILDYLDSGDLIK